NGIEKGRVFFGVPILGNSQPSAVCRSIRIKSLEIRRTEHINSRCELIRVVNQHSQRGEPAVRSAHYDDFLWINGRLSSDPIDCSGEVLEGIPALGTIVHCQIRFAIAGASADIRREDSISPGDQVLIDGIKRWALLALRAAMNAENHRE